MYATVIFPIFSSRSFKLFDKQKIAITSDATVISKPSSLGKPLATPPRFMFIDRRARSFKSTTRLHTILLTSIFNLFPQ